MRFALLLFSVLALPACGGNGRVNPAPAGDASNSIPVYALQGSGRQSPLRGRQVSFRGIVTGDFQNGDQDAANNLGGFFVQDEAGDNDSRTSDGVFVFDKFMDVFVDVEVRNRVVVTGSVVESFGETQVIPTSIQVLPGWGAVPPTPVALPAAASVLNSDGIAIADLEAYEGMLVRLPQTLTVVDAFGLERYGDLTLAAGGRIQQFTNASSPDVVAYGVHRESVSRSTLILDDGTDRQNLQSPRFLFPYANNDALRLGDTVTSLTGTLRYSRGSGDFGAQAFRLMPVGDPTLVSSRSRPASPPPVGGALRVMSFNALNFFTTPDEGKDNCGPAGSSACRGADSETELARQRAKLATAIVGAGADIVGLMEIENNRSESLRSIVGALNAASEGGWSYIRTGTLGSDAIRVGLVFQSAQVAPVGDFAVLDGGVDVRFNDSKNRPVLAQTFVSVANGGRITVAVNHFKSKGSDCGDIGDPDLNDGQGNCNATRSMAAAALADWLATDPTGSGDADVLIIGDLNAYLREDPLQTLEDAGYVNTIDDADGRPARSFVFRGEAGALDHALASPSLLSQVSGAAEWHINADEPPILDYNLDGGRSPAFFDPQTPFRASDHDPVIVGLDLLPD